MERRVHEVAWVHLVPDDFITDAQHYGFGDVRKMSGPEALRIAYRLKNYFNFDNEGNPKSSVVISLRRMMQDFENQEVFMADEVVYMEDETEARIASDEQLAHIASWSRLDSYDTPIGEFVSLSA